MKQKVNRIIYIIALFLILIAISIFYLDENIAYWLAQSIFYKPSPEIKQYVLLLKYYSYLPFIVFGLSPIFIFVSMLSFIYFKAVKKIFLVLFLSAVSVQIAVSIKTLLKFVFSRDNVAHFLKTNDSSFKWFEDLHSVSAFPSGHTLVLVSFITVIWLLYPKFKILYLAILMCLFLTLMLLHYHFLSDILAGILIGWLIGVFVVYVYKFFAKEEFLKYTMYNIKQKEKT